MLTTGVEGMAQSTPRFDSFATYNSTPMNPPDPEHLLWHDTGTVRIAVEYRIQSKEAMAQYLTADDRYADKVDEMLALFEKKYDHLDTDHHGISFHVYEAGADVERLRFDCFPSGPHYHYVTDGMANPTYSVWFDVLAHGDLLDWFLHLPAHRLSAMLVAAGADPDAARLDDESFSNACAAIALDVAELTRAHLDEATRG
jgi:hypothetical protein